MKIDRVEWSDYFDHIYCVHYAPYKERKVELEKELDRVGILSSGIFSYHYTFPTPFDDDLMKNPEFNHAEFGMRFNKGAVNLAMGHYNIMAEAVSFGYNRILIIEDDIAFLKDINMIKNILDKMPDKDIIIFDKITPDERQYKMSLQYDKINDYYVNTGALVLWCSDCYSVNTKGMKHIIKNQETWFNVADYYTNCFAPYGGPWNIQFDGITRAFAIKNLACQKPNDITVSDHGESKSIYQQNNQYNCGIDLNDYNV